MYSFVFNIIPLAGALSIDASIVAFSQGLLSSKNKRKNSIYLAFFLGFFQFLFPILGWYLARFIYIFVNNIAHYLAGAIFITLGCKIIFDTYKNNKQEEITLLQHKQQFDYFPIKFVLLISIATSIDAFAAGMSLYFLKKSIWLPAITIGVITFINSLIGFWCGFWFKKFNSKNIEICSGLILIALGIKIIIEKTL